ncbi:YqaJ viral recombinase family protein [Candidatus Pacearchaeota archaeon]|nr:YqaJ viral recombinase family protein [Candidatus Pacearchaeota archaeon]
MGSKPTGISASRGAAILGLSKWNTRVDGFLKIMEERDPGFCDENGYEKPEHETNIILEMGLAFEPAVCSLAENKQDMTIVDHEKLSCHSQLKYVTCHQDGGYLGLKAHSVPRILHEGKTTNVFTYRDEWGEPGTNRIPREYQVQGQQQMLCTGLNECIVSVLVFPFRQTEIETIPADPMRWAQILDEMGYFHQYYLTADQKLHNSMLKKYWKFWERHILTGKPPRPRTYRDIKRLVKAPKGTIVSTAQIERWSSEYKDIGQEINLADARKKELKTKILEYMNKQADVPIDDESQEKWILKNRKGRKLHSFNGKTFR